MSPITNFLHTLFCVLAFFGGFYFFLHGSIISSARPQLGENSAYVLPVLTASPHFPNIVTDFMFMFVSIQSTGALLSV